MSSRSAPCPTTSCPTSLARESPYIGSRPRVEAGETGFVVPGEGVRTEDWSRSGKKTSFVGAGGDENDGQHHPNRIAGNQHRTTPNLLGGPVPVDVRYREANRFETEAQAAQRSTYGVGEGTQVNQLTSKARSAFVRGKREVEPMHEAAMRGGGYDATRGGAVRSENPYELGGSHSYGNSSSQMAGNDGHDPQNLVGYRQHHGGQQKSLTQGLAGSILDTVHRPQRKHIVTAPYATDSSGPTDPYADKQGGRKKELFVENFNKSGGIPGYTGRGGGGGGRRDEW